MSETKPKRTPPYPSHTLFAQFINNLVQTGTIPKEINKSIFPQLHHGNTSSLLGALRYLNLIGNDGVPSERLVQLVAARMSPQILKPIVQEAYSFVFAGQSDLAQTTAEMLTDRFQNQGLSGETVQKAVTFFIALAIDAGIPISGSFMRQRHPTRTKAIRRRRTRAPELPTASPPRTPSEPTAMADLTAESILRLFDGKHMTQKERNAVLTLVHYLKMKEAETTETKETVIMV